MSGSQIGHAPQDAGEMLQVKDMEFELVRPNFAHFQGAAARTSEDSGVLGREGFIDLRQDGYLRPESPTVSVSSGGHSPNMWPQPPTTDFEFVMDAHRNCELKWMWLQVVLACVAIAQVQRSQEASPGRCRPLCGILFGPTSLMVKPVVCQACI